MTELERIGKYKNAWKKFQDKMNFLKKERSALLTRISEKLDQQHMEKLRKKIQSHE